MEGIRYCQSCGAYLPLGRRKCLACGSPIEVPKDESDQNVLETTKLEDDTYMVYVDGVPVQSFRVGQKENVLDLDNPRIKVLWNGVTRDATIVHRMYHPTDFAGRDITGRMYRHESMEVILRIELKN